MYAIVEINGQQFKVEEGKKLFVNHMKDVEAGTHRRWCKGSMRGG